jgi:predicted dehydrogenase
MSGVAIVGCGVISDTYARTLGELEFVRVTACVDALPARASDLAGRYDARALELDVALADPDVDVVVNLTPPQAHAEVSRRVLTAGKSVFSEKPLGIELGEGTALVMLARERGVRLGCAPDTFLGAGLQTARAAIDRGDIGEPLAANAFMLQAGPEWWHPNPGLFYERGAGPLFDMGPYYLTTLVQLLGPARAVTATARVSRSRRPIHSEPQRGALIDVEVPTHRARPPGAAPAAAARHRPRRHGVGATHGSSAPRVGDPGFARARDDVRHHRVRGARQPGRAGEHVRAGRAAPGRAAAQHL